MPTSHCGSGHSETSEALLESRTRGSGSNSGHLSRRYLTKLYVSIRYYYETLQQMCRDSLLHVALLKLRASDYCGLCLFLSMREGTVARLGGSH